MDPSTPASQQQQQQEEGQQQQRSVSFSDKSTQVHSYEPAPYSPPPTVTFNRTPVQVVLEGGRAEKKAMTKASAAMNEDMLNLSAEVLDSVLNDSVDKTDATGTAEAMAKKKAMTKASAAMNEDMLNLSAEVLDSVLNDSVDKTDATGAAEAMAKKAMTEASAAMNEDMMNWSAEVLASMVKDSVVEDMENIKVPGSVPNNGRSVLSPAAYCHECVKRIASYLEGENLSNNVIREDGEATGEKVIVFKETERMAGILLDALNLRVYDHVTVQGFNLNAMRRGGKLYSMSLSQAAVIDESEDIDKYPIDLFAKLAGKEVEKATLSSGIVMSSDISALSKLSENDFKTHGQVVDKNIDSDDAKWGCSCMKSHEWVGKRYDKVNRLAKKLNNQEDSEEDEPRDSGIDWLKIRHSADYNDSDEEEGKSDSDEEEDKSDSDEEAEADDEDSIDGRSTTAEKETENDTLYWNDDTDFRPSASIPYVENQENFDNRIWAKLRTRSCCISLCRHNIKCPMDDDNKHRIIKALKLIRIPDPPKNIETVTCTSDPGVHYTIEVPDKNLLFSLGSSTYEARAYRIPCWGIDNYDDDYNEHDDCDSKVYVTAHTIASPFGVPPPISNISHSTDYGYYKTFRVCLPGHFSGTNKDESLAWRSLMYHNMAENLVKTAYSRYPNTPYTISNLVEDGRGDMSGNYLKCRDDIDKTNVVFKAISTLKNISANSKQLRVTIGKFLMEPVKQQIIEFNHKRNDLLEKINDDNVTLEQKQAMQNAYFDSLRRLKNTAVTFQSWVTNNLILERDIGMTFNSMAANIKGFSDNIHTLQLAEEYASYLV